jgi:arabinofuranan 3-O-arabinosyltransferase
VRRPTAAALWAAGAALFIARVVVALHDRGLDFWLVWRSLRSFVVDGFPYRNRYFPYPPSSLLLLGGFGAMPWPRAHFWFVLLDAAGILVGAACCHAAFGLRWRSPAGALMLIAVALYAPVIQTLNAANVNGLVFAGQSAALLLAARGRFTQAGLPLGLSLAIKPILLPLVPLLALGRQWAGAAVALAVPIVLSVPAILVIADAAVYARRVVPCPPGRFSPENVALTGAAGYVGILEIALPLRIAVGAAVLWVACRMWRRRHPEPAVALAEAMGLALVATFLLACYAWPYYALYLFPTFVAVVRPGAAVRRWPAALALYGVGGPDIRLWLMAGEVGDTLVHLRSTAGLLLFLLVLGLGTTRTGPAPATPAARGA